MMQDDVLHSVLKLSSPGVQHAAIQTTKVSTKNIKTWGLLRTLALLERSWVLFVAVVVVVADGVVVLVVVVMLGQT